MASFLKPRGKLFVHIFCHRELTYSFEDDGRSDWMARHFFTGGIMPSANLLHEFSQHMKIDRQWQLDGTHYGQTCEAWLRKADQETEALLRHFATGSSEVEARVQLQRWRMFFMACAELFNFNNGTEWGVGHYLLSRQTENATPPATLAEPVVDMVAG